ncbi:MAG: hypothetical protein JKY52_00920 [Flavobacteriales bacterium]|nr:hypothetical protein [Flavobacteriales bacterium]
MKKLEFDKSFLVFLAVCLMFTSCTIQADRKEKKIVGRWLAVNVIDPAADSLQEHWIFDGDGGCSILVIGSDTVVADQGEWNVSQKTTKAFLNTAFEGKYSAAFNYNVSWRIKDLNKDVLFITFDDSGIRTKEFKKL